MSDAGSIGTGVAAITALLTAISVAGFNLSKVLSDRRLEKEQAAEAPVKKVNLIVDGAEAVVAVLRQDYERVHREAQELSREVFELRQQLRDKDEAIARLREKVAKMETEIKLMATELARLQSH